jgi:hypothetical protein
LERLERLEQLELGRFSNVLNGALVLSAESKEAVERLELSETIERDILLLPNGCCLFD